jgi:hypothetical protein
VTARRLDAGEKKLQSIMERVQRSIVPPSDNALGS